MVLYYDLAKGVTWQAPNGDFDLEDTGIGIKGEWSEQSEQAVRYLSIKPEAVLASSQV